MKLSIRRNSDAHSVSSCNYDEPNLIVCEDPVNVELGVRRKAEALFARGNHPGHKGAVAQPILQRLLVGPVGPLFHLLEVGVGLAQARVKHRHLAT